MRQATFLFIGVVMLCLAGCGGGAPPLAGPTSGISAISSQSGERFRTIGIRWSSSLQPGSWRVDVKPESGTFSTMANILAPNIREISVDLSDDPPEFSKWIVRLSAIKDGQVLESRETTHQFLLSPVAIQTGELQFDPHLLSRRFVSLSLFPNSQLSSAFLLTRKVDGGLEQTAPGSTAPLATGGFQWIDPTLTEATEYRYTAYPVMGSTKGIGSICDIRAPLLAPEIESVEALPGGATRIRWTTQSTRTSSFRVLRSHLDLENGSWIQDPSSPDLPSANRSYDDTQASASGPIMFRVLAKGPTHVFEALSQTLCLPKVLPFGTKSMNWSIQQFPQSAAWFRTADGTSGYLESSSSPTSNLSMQLGILGPGSSTNFKGWSTPAQYVRVAEVPNGKPQILELNNMRLQQAWFDGTVWLGRSVAIAQRRGTYAGPSAKGDLHQIYQDAFDAWHYQYLDVGKDLDLDLPSGLFKNSPGNPTALPGGEVVTLDPFWRDPGLVVLKPDQSWERQAIPLNADMASFSPIQVDSSGTCYGLALCTIGSTQDLRLFRRTSFGQPEVLPIPSLPVQGFSDMDLAIHVSLALSPSGKISISVRRMAQSPQIYGSSRISGGNPSWAGFMLSSCLERKPKNELTRRRGGRGD